MGYCLNAQFQGQRVNIIFLRTHPVCISFHQASRLKFTLTPVANVNATCPAHSILIQLIILIMFCDRHQSWGIFLCIHLPATYSLFGATILLSTLLQNTLDGTLPLEPQRRSTGMTNSMMWRPSWGANKNNFQLFKIFLAFDGHRKFHYRIDKSPPLLPILHHCNPVHAAIYFNIIHEYEENIIILYVLFQASV